MKKSTIILCVVAISSIILFLIFNDFSDCKKQVYSLSSFNGIILDESTLYDVVAIAPDTVFNAVGKGSTCSILLDDGNELYIEFLGPDMIVSKIEIVQGTKDKNQSD